MTDDSDELLISRNRFGKITSKSLTEVALQGVVSASEKSGGSLPCLYSNNCIRNDENNPVYPPSPLAFELKTQVRKSASCLAWNVEHFCQKFGIENLGFFTLTFRDHVVDIREAQRRFKSLAVNVLKKRYPHYIRVVERQKSGRIHYHLLVVVGEDIRTGFDFRSVENGDYRSANRLLRDEWAFWRKTAPAYRFGRTELLPIKSGAEAIGRYVGKYIGKHFTHRLDEDKGARLVDYSRGARMASTRLQFVSEGSAEWRRKVGIFIHYIADTTGCEPSFEGVRRMFGPRWAYHWREFISKLP